MDTPTRSGIARCAFALPIAALVLAGPLTGQDLSTSPAQSPAAQEEALETLRSLMEQRVVTASKFLQNLEDAPGVITVLTRDEIDRFGATTLRDVLARVPGVSLTAGLASDRSMIAVRGDQIKNDGSHVLFLINGRPLREPLEGGILTDLLEGFPLGAIDRIEVIRGPGSVLYGTNAFSGVVNLITRNPGETGIAVQAFAGQTDSPSGGGGAQVSLQRGNLSVFGAGQFRQRPTIHTLHPAGNPELSPGYVQPADLQDRGQGAFFSASFRRVTLDASWTQAHGTAVVPTFPTGRDRWRRGFANLGIQLVDRGGWKSRLDFTYTRSGLWMEDTPVTSVRRTSSELLLEWSNEWELTPADRLTFGALGSRVRGLSFYTATDPWSLMTDTKRFQTSAYAQLEHDLDAALTLIGGVQVNKIEGIDWNAVPRAGLIWHLTPALTFKALYSEAFRAPSLFETTVRHVALIGTPGLSPEAVRTVDAGLTYHSGRLLTGINVFQSNQRDTIAWDRGVLPAIYQNSGHARFRGAEWESKYYLLEDRLFATGSLLYQTNRVTSLGSEHTPVPNWMVKGGVSYRSPRGWLLGVFDTHMGRSPDGGGISGVVPAFDQVTAKFRLDLSRILPSAPPQLGFFVYGDNLLNQALRVADNDFGYPGGVPTSAGRALYFGFEIASFGE